MSRLFPENSEPLTFYSKKTVCQQKPALLLTLSALEAAISQQRVVQFEFSRKINVTPHS
jgi:hypothetical protein